MQVRHALGWSWNASLSFMLLPICHFLTYTSNDHPCSVQMLECSGPSNLHPPSSKMCTLLSKRDLLTSGELSRGVGGGWNKHTMQAMVCAMMVMGNQLEPQDFISLPTLPLSQESENMYTCCP